MFVAVAVAATVAWELSGDAVTDIPLYRTYGERIADGLVPYRDFGFEYPPGALPALVAARARHRLARRRTAIVFVAEIAIVGARRGRSSSPTALARLGRARRRRAALVARRRSPCSARCSAASS